LDGKLLGAAGVWGGGGAQGVAKRGRQIKPDKKPEKRLTQTGGEIEPVKDNWWEN